MSITLKIDPTLSSTGGTDVTFDFQTQSGNLRFFEVSSDPLLSKRKLRSTVNPPKISAGRPGGYTKAVSDVTVITPFTCADGARDENYYGLSVKRNVETTDAEVSTNLKLLAQYIISYANNILDNTQHT